MLEFDIFLWLIPDDFARQGKTSWTWKGLQGVYTIANNILITGQGHNSKRDHESNLPGVHQKYRERNIKPQKPKECEAVRLLVSMAMYLS